MKYYEDFNLEITDITKLKTWLRKRKNKLLYSVIKNKIHCIRLLTRVQIQGFAGIPLHVTKEEEIWSKFKSKNIFITSNGFVYFNKYSEIIEYKFIEEITKEEIEEINKKYKEDIKNVVEINKNELSNMKENFINGCYMTPEMFIRLYESYHFKLPPRTKYWLITSVLGLNYIEEKFNYNLISDKRYNKKIDCSDLCERLKFEIELEREGMDEE